MHLRSRLVRSPFAAGLLAGLAAPAALFAGGMALTMQNGVHLGQAYSAGASAEDASTVYFNPAGMLWLDRSQASLSLTYIGHSGGFTDAGSVTAGTIPTGGGNGGTAGQSSVVPTLHFAHPLSERAAIGFGLSIPYGLSTEYEAGWVGRYHALKSDLKTLNFGPAFAWQATDRMAIGLGIDWQRADVTLTNAIDFGLLGFLNGIPDMAPGSADGLLRASGDDTATGFNLGVLFELAAGSRLGVHYRSKLDYTLRGTARFTDVPAPFAPVFFDQSATAPLELPERLSVSLHHQLTPSVALTADWSWWKWSRFETLAIDFENPATTDVAQPQNWKDASIVSAGIRWAQNGALTWRAGIAYNETPVPSAELRTARIPDADRVWLCAGASYRFGENLRADVGFAHLAVRHAPTMNDDTLGHVLVGDYDLSVNILSLQGTWSF